MTRGLRNLLSSSPEPDATQLGMFLEITQALDLDGATIADWQEWQTCCHDTNVAHDYVKSAMYISTRAEVQS